MPTTPTVVLAEDSPLMRDGLTGVLNRFGHQVLAAVTLRREHPDLPVLVLSQYIEQSYAAHPPPQPAPRPPRTPHPA